MVVLVVPSSMIKIIESEHSPQPETVPSNITPMVQFFRVLIKVLICIDKLSNISLLLEPNKL